MIYFIAAGVVILYVALFLLAGVLISDGFDEGGGLGIVRIVGGLLMILLLLGGLFYAIGTSSDQANADCEKIGGEHTRISKGYTYDPVTKTTTEDYDYICVKEESE